MKISYIKNYIYVILNILTGLLIPFVTFPYISKIFGPEILGKINFMNSIIYYYNILASFGIATYGLREISKIRNDKEKMEIKANEIFNLNIIFSILSTVLYLLMIFFIKKIRNDHIIFIIYSIVILFNFLNIDWLFNSYEDFKYLAIRTIILRIIVVIFIFKYIKNKEDYILYIILLVISEIGIKILNILYSKQYLKFKIKLLDNNLLKHLNSMYKIFLMRILGGVSTNLDKIMLGFLKNSTEVGLYSVGIKFLFLLIPLIETIGIVISPKTSELINDKKEREIKKIIQNNYNIILLISIPMMIGTYLLSSNLIKIFIGIKFLESVAVMKILSLLFLLIPLSDLFANRILLNYNQEKKLLEINILTAIFNVLLNIIFILKYGMIGASIATLIGYLISCAYKYKISKKFVKIKIINKNLIVYLISSMTFIGLKKIMQITLVSNMKLIILFILYCIFIYLFLLMMFKDKYIISFVKKIKLRR